MNLDEHFYGVMFILQFAFFGHNSNVIKCHHHVAQLPVDMVLPSAVFLACFDIQVWRSCKLTTDGGNLVLWHTCGTTWLPTKPRIVSESKRYIHSHTQWEKPERKKLGETDKLTQTWCFLGERNNTTLRSWACWWVAHLLSCHGNSRPRGEGFRLNPGGHRLIEWLSGCKTNDDVLEPYWQTHFTQGTVKSNKRFVCVCSRSAGVCVYSMH